MSEEEILKEVNAIMDKLDIDKSGNVDYTEWAVGTIDKKDILSHNKLLKAFNLFDRVSVGEALCLVGWIRIDIS